MIYQTAYPKAEKGVGYNSIAKKIAMFYFSEKKQYEHAIETRRIARKIAKTAPYSNVNYKVLGTVALLHNIYNRVSRKKEPKRVVRFNRVKAQLRGSGAFSENQIDQITDILRDHAWDKLNKHCVEALILRTTEELIHG